jgi:uncharacterized YccA/Bax inhibitor family protein
MSNPVLSAENFAKSYVADAPVMTMDGTVTKSSILVGLVIASAVIVWNYAALFLPLLFPVLIVALVVGLVVSFAPRTAPYLAPVYALLEGLAIGTISTFFEADYPGIVIQAVSLTFATFIMMLWLYRGRVLQATEKFKTGVMAATGAIALIYIVSFVGSVSGWYSVPYIHESGWLGIGFSVAVTGIAALNLILDFDEIETGVREQAAKYMEWYAAFGLMVTLIWLYLEILRLLSKLRDK